MCNDMLLFIKVSELIEACKRGDIQLAKSIIGEGTSYNCIDEVNDLNKVYFVSMCVRDTNN